VFLQVSCSVACRERPKDWYEMRALGSWRADSPIGMDAPVSDVLDIRICIFLICNLSLFQLVILYDHRMFGDEHYETKGRIATNSRR